MGAYKRTYTYYNKDQATRVLKSLKRDGIRAKMTKRKLSARDRMRYKSDYVYHIYRWKI